MDGGYSDWGEWSKCSKTCRVGFKDRVRSCNNPKPSGGGKSRDHLGPSAEGDICNQNKCPVGQYYLIYRLSAAAFIIFFVILVRRLFWGDVELIQRRCLFRKKILNAAGFITFFVIRVRRLF